MVAGEFAAIVLGQGARVEIEGLDADLVANRGSLAADTRHQLFDDVQLVECGPVGVAASPVGIRLQPDGESFGEILGGMGLRVPLAEVMNISAATRTSLVTVRVLKRCGPEDLAPALPPPQPIGIVDGVSCLMAKDAHKPPRIAALDLAHDVSFEFLEARVREVKRHGDAWHAVR